MMSGKSHYVHAGPSHTKKISILPEIGL